VVVPFCKNAKGISLGCLGLFFKLIGDEGSEAPPFAYEQVIMP